MPKPTYVTHPDMRHKLSSRTGQPAYLEPPIIGQVMDRLPNGYAHVYFPTIGVRTVEENALSSAQDKLSELEAAQISRKASDA